MNTAEKYIYAVYKNKSFSKAAKELFVSQPSLSATVKKHEAKLGYDIFNRKTAPVVLTREGELYIEYLQDMLELELRLKEHLSSLHTAPSKTISIGGSNSAAFRVIPKLCREYHRRFPDVRIKIDVGERGHTTILYDKLKQGALDIFIGSNITSEDFSTVKLLEEKYMVVIRRDYPGIEQLLKYSLTAEEVLTGVYPQEKEISDISLFKDIAVFPPGANSKSHSIFSSFLKATKPLQYSIINFRRMDMQYGLMSEGMGAVLAPQSAIIARQYNDNELCCFVISVPDNTRQIMLAHKKDAPLSQCVKDFIKTAYEMYAVNAEDSNRDTR